jgi:hypothetical protein
MFPAILLMTAITIIFAVLNRTWRWQVCPICAGVSGSWLILTAGIVLARWSGDYKLPIAMLMGGTVVGIAFQGETKFDWAKKGIYTWRAPVIILGMPIAYWLFKNMSLMTLVIEIVTLAILMYSFFIRSYKVSKRKNGKHITELENKMKNCC